MPDSDHLISPDPNRSPYQHMSDDDLLAAYQRTKDEPGNAEVDATLAEIERRGLPV